MLNQETIDEIRIALYEDVGLIYDFYSEQWSDDALRDISEYVPDITQADLDEYRKVDAPYIAAVLKLAVKAANDEELLNGLFGESKEKAYELVKDVVGDKIPYEDFIDIVEYGGKPFFKSFEGVVADDGELSEEALESAAGGVDNDPDHTTDDERELIHKIIKIIVHCFTAESQVDTPTGTKAIKDIEAGDIVYSIDEAGNKVERKVASTTGGEASVIEVHFDNGKVWNTTSTQWFYDGKTFHNVWQHNNRDIITLDGTTKITDIIETGKKTNVYDFVIDGGNIMFIEGIAAEGYGT
jgi:hypothetical protein